jgi:hypothetical protein
VGNFLDGERKPRGAPTVNFLPTVQTFYNDTCNANVTV